MKYIQDSICRCHTGDCDVVMMVFNCVRDSDGHCTSQDNLITLITYHYRPYAPNLVPAKISGMLLASLFGEQLVLGSKGTTLGADCTSICKCATCCTRGFNRGERLTGVRSYGVGITGPTGSCTEPLACHHCQASCTLLIAFQQAVGASARAPVSN